MHSPTTSRFVTHEDHAPLNATEPPPPSERWSWGFYGAFRRSELSDLDIDQLLDDAGENLNEHVTGGGWPPVNVRHQMLEEAVDIIRSLWGGGYVSVDGRPFQVDSAKLWDLPDRPLKLGIAASGAQSARLAGQKADCLIVVEASPAVVAAFDAAGGKGKPRVGQLPISYDPTGTPP
jgi:G6PDH family F420-dependent oxidoreductase